MIVDSLDGVPENLREHYSERDGKFQLQVQGAFSVIDRDKVSGLYQRGILSISLPKLADRRKRSRIIEIKEVEG